MFSSISSKVPTLRIEWAGQTIDNLTVTKILFWNAGNGTIRRNDIPPNAPVRLLSVNGARIVEARILEEKDDANSFALSPVTGDSFDIGFEYVDKDEGAVIQIAHTGKSSKDISLTGRIMGVRKELALKPSSDFASRKERKTELAMSAVFIVTGLFAVSAILLNLTIYFVPLSFIVPPLTPQPSPYGGLLLIIISLPAAVFFLTRNILRPLPPGFQTFEDEEDEEEKS